MKKRNWLQITTDCVEAFFLNIFKVIGLKKFVSWYKEHQTGMRYLVFGGISTVINIIVFQLLYNIGLSTLVSNSIAWIISVIFAYFTNKMVVFYYKADNIKDLFREVLSFLGCRIGTLVIDEVFMYITIDLLGFNSMIMKVLSNIIVIILNYILSKVLVFKRKNS